MNKKTMKNLHKSLIFRIFDTLKAFSVQRSAFSVQRKFTDKQPKKYKNPLWGGATFSEVDFLCLDEIRANGSVSSQQSAIGSQQSAISGQPLAYYPISNLKPQISN